MEKFPRIYYHPHGDYQTLKRIAYVNVSSPATSAVVAAPSSPMCVGVFAIEIRADVDATVIFKSGTTVIDATEYVAAQGGSNRGNADNQTPLLVCAPGEALNATCTGSGNVAIRVIWAPIPK
jgi:hypothetical protein